MDCIKNDVITSKIGTKIRDNWCLWFESYEQCIAWCEEHGL